MRHKKPDPNSGGLEFCLLGKQFQSLYTVKFDELRKKMSEDNPNEEERKQAALLYSNYEQKAMAIKARNERKEQKRLARKSKVVRGGLFHIYTESIVCLRLISVMFITTMAFAFFTYPLMKFLFWLWVKEERTLKTLFRKGLCSQITSPS